MISNSCNDSTYLKLEVRRIADNTHSHYSRGGLKGGDRHNVMLICFLKLCRDRKASFHYLEIAMVVKTVLRAIIVLQLTILGRSWRERGGFVEHAPEYASAEYLGTLVRVPGLLKVCKTV